MFRQGRVHERVVAVQKIQHGAVFAHEVGEKAERLLEHRPTEFVVEGGETFAVDGVVLLEAAKIQPVSGKLSREIAKAIVLQHPARLGRKDRGVLKLAGGGAREQLEV